MWIISFITVKGEPKPIWQSKQSTIMSRRNLMTVVKSMKSLRIEQEEGEKIASSLERRVERVFESADKCEVAISRQGGNYEVRSHFEGDDRRMICFCNVKETGLMPDDFLPFMENFSSVWVDAKPNLEEVTVLESADDREGLKLVISMPFPLQDRCMFVYKYFVNRDDDEYMIILSNFDTETLLEKHVTEEDAENYVIAQNFLQGYWVKPIRDEGGKVTGSGLRYFFSCDVGGLVPQFMQQSILPKYSLDSAKHLIEYIEEQKGSK